MYSQIKKKIYSSRFHHLNFSIQDQRKIHRIIFLVDIYFFFFLTIIKFGLLFIIDHFQQIFIKKKLKCVYIYMFVLTNKLVCII